MRSLRMVLGFVIAGFAAPAAAQGGTDIWITPMKLNTGHVAFGAPRNVTDRPGYDNQPAWSPHGDVIYFSSARGDGQNDIWSVEVATGKQTRITTTSPESEYSPAVVAGGSAISVVRVERDSTQRLWRIPLRATAPTVLLPLVKPVGYYAWADDYNVALYVLGNPKLGVPQTFEMADIRTGAQTFVAHNIGRALAKIPGANAISFVQKDSSNQSTIMRYDVSSKKITPIAALPAGVEDYAWTPTGRLLAAKDSDILEWSSLDWKPVTNLAAQGISGITRMVSSPDGSFLAFVAKDKSP